MSNLPPPNPPRETRKPTVPGLIAATKAEIFELERAMAVLDRELEEMTAPLEVRPVRTGLPLRALDLLRCPRCAGTPSLAEATLDSRGVHEGILTCPCGYEARIREGILRTGNVNPSACLGSSGQASWALPTMLPPVFSLSAMNASTSRPSVSSALYGSRSGCRSS